MADQDVGDAGGVVHAKALPVPFHPLAELPVGGVAPLFDSGTGCVAQDGLRIDQGSQPKVKFLGGGQRRGIRIVGDVEVRNNPEQSLFLLGVHLLDGQFVRRQSHIHFADGGCDLQNDRRERWILPGNHGNIGLLVHETTSRDGEGVGPGLDRGEVERARLVGKSSAQGSGPGRL
jgi:hypothetical protein